MEMEVVEGSHSMMTVGRLKVNIGKVKETSYSSYSHLVQGFVWTVRTELEKAKNTLLGWYIYPLK